MKKLCILIVELLVFNIAFPQENDFSRNKVIAGNADRSLKASSSQCALSLLFGLTGGILIAADLEKPGAAMLTGVIIGGGGVGMEFHSAILNKRAYHQVKMLQFAPEDSLLRIRMMKNIRSARTVAIIKSVTPIIAVAAGAIAYSVANPYDLFFEAGSFWVPVLSICTVGLLMNIPEMVLIRSARKDLETYRQKLILGSTYR